MNLPEYLKSLKPDIDVLGEWACFGNPKTAQKSIMLGVLYERQIRYRRGWRNWRRVWDYVIAPNLEQVLLFTFVRNPWDKVVSAFFFLKERGEIGLQWKFRDYVKDVLAVEGPAINRHFREQTPTFMFQGKLIPGMYVGRFENLARDWAHVARIVGETPLLPRRNVSHHGPYKTYYDEETKEIVRSLYAKEIEALGYEY